MSLQCVYLQNNSLYLYTKIKCTKKYKNKREKKTDKIFYPIFKRLDLCLFHLKCILFLSFLLGNLCISNS